MTDISKPNNTARNYESAFAPEKLASQPGVFVGRYGDAAPAPLQNLAADLRGKPELTPP